MYNKIRSEHHSILDPLILRNPLIVHHYETMISKSKLNIFAMGKHWGWREIMFISLLTGVPVLTDKPIYQTYFPFDEFKIKYTCGDWSEIRGQLDYLTNEKRNSIIKHNQNVFDKRLSPDAVAKYVINQLS